MNEIKVTFHDAPESQACLFAVIITISGGKLVLCRHHERKTWEFPGGHIEPGESPHAAACRELNEETGATDFDISKICNYGVCIGDGETTYGAVYAANVREFGDELHMEIAETRLCDHLPREMTYPAIHPPLLREAVRRGLVSPRFIKEESL